MTDNLLLDAGVPEPLWKDKDAALDFLCRKVIALSGQSNIDTIVLDEERLADIEAATYKRIQPLNNMDVFKMYNSSFLLSLTEVERVGVKSALSRFADERNFLKPEHWM